MRRARRIIAWLSQPIQYRSGPDDGLDPERFGRSFGRMVGGNVHLGAEPRDSGAAESRRRGGRSAPAGPGHPRWVELLLMAMTVILSGIVVAIIVVVETH